MVELVGTGKARLAERGEAGWLARALANLEETVASAALIVVVGSVCWGVLSRYVTQQPAVWSGEVAAIAFAWVIFLGAAAGFKRGLHVSIDMLVALLPAGARRIDLAVELLMAAFCLYMVWLGATSPSPTGKSHLGAPAALIHRLCRRAGRLRPDGGPHRPAGG